MRLGLHSCILASPPVTDMVCGQHVTRHTSHVTRHTSHVTRHTSHVTHALQRGGGHTVIADVAESLTGSLPSTSHITRHMSLVTRHSSHVTRHTSHVTRHTLHVTRHTSHVTRHTSHVTGAMLADQGLVVASMCVRLLLLLLLLLQLLLLLPPPPLLLLLLITPRSHRWVKSVLLPHILPQNADSGVALVQLALCAIAFLCNCLFVQLLFCAIACLCN